MSMFDAVAGMSTQVAHSPLTLPVIAGVVTTAVVYPSVFHTFNPGDIKISHARRALHITSGVIATIFGAIVVSGALGAAALLSHGKHAPNEPRAQYQQPLRPVSAQAESRVPAVRFDHV